ncbi:MAG: rhomboid family intramembrane serine protease [Lutibacter sp.]|nr:MAG: rhomboid family intramembrane serine protease [Lutibacter sp.]
MEDSKIFKFSNSVLIAPFLLVFSIWFVYWIEIKFGYNFTKYGVYPQSIKGLRGVLFSPFIHSGTSHLFNNSIPLAVLTASLFFFYNKVALRILFFGTLYTGFLTWIIARDSYHIGASGVVYLLFSFIFFSGIIRKHFRLIALSLIVIFLYGSMIWYVFPIKEKMSWEGHLSGFLVGLLFAITYRKIGPQKPTYIHKQTDFDLQFDEEGNYSPIIEEESEGISE